MIPRPTGNHTEPRVPGFVPAIVVSISLAAVIHALLLLKGFYSATLDESGRTLDAYNWVKGNTPLATVWLPFYKVIVGGALTVVPDLVVAPRVVSFLFGIGALGAIVWLARVLFSNTTTTLLTGLIAAVLPQRVVLSIAPLAEIMFISVMTLAMGFLARWLLLGRQRDLWLSAGLIAVGSSVRYEGWIFAGVFALWLLLLSVRKTGNSAVNLVPAAGAILVSFSFVGFWVLLHLVENGRPFGFIADTTGRYVLIHGDSLSSLLLNNPLTQFVLQNAWTLNILGVFSLAFAVRQRAIFTIAALVPFAALLAVSLVALLGKGMPTHGFWRIPALWSVLLIPFTANGIASLLDAPHRLKKLRTIAGVAILACLLGLCMKGTLAMTGRSAFSRDDLAVGRFVQREFSQSTRPHRVLIESDIWDYVNVMIASQHPEWFILNSGFDPTEHKDPLLAAEAPFDATKLQQMDVALLVFRREDYTDYLNGRPGIRKLSAFGPWTVYALLPENPTGPFDMK